MRQYKTKAFIKDGLSLGLFFSGDSKSCEEHTHEFAEIIYVTGGRGIETVNGTEHSVGRGDLLFINCGSVHKITPVSHYSYINICFSPEIMGERIITRENAFDLLSLTAVDEFRREYGAEIITFLGEEQRFIEALLHDMLNEFTSELPERSAVLESYMTILIAKILRKCRFKANEGAKDRMWREISSFIEENLDQRLTLGALAKKCFYNPSYFSRVFKEKFGTTLVDHITKERVSAAAALLRESALSSDGIAEKCGFGDRTSLYRAFIRIYGCTPTEYRKKEQKM